MISEIPIPKETVVVVGLLSSNRNKALWGEDAMEWKPERWLAGLPETVTDAKIPGVYSNLCVHISPSPLVSLSFQSEFAADDCSNSRPSVAG